MSTVFINNTCDSNISMMFSVIIFSWTSCIDMHRCYRNGANRKKSISLGIACLVWWLLWETTIDIRKGSWSSACVTVPCIHLQKCVKPRADNFDKQTTHKPVTYRSEHPIHLFSPFLTPFGRASVNQPTYERTDEDPNTHSLSATGDHQSFCLIKHGIETRLHRDTETK